MNGLDVHFFFAPEDERDFSKTLVAQFPGVVFIDGVRLTNLGPVLRESIDACENFSSMIWNQSIYPSLPQLPIPPGTVQGPDMLYFDRPRKIALTLTSGQEADALVSGSLSWGGGDPRDEGREKMRAFAKSAIRIVSSMHTGILVPWGRRVDQVQPGGVRGYIVGPAAARWCMDQDRQVLKVSGGRHIYKVYPGERTPAA